MVYDAARRRIVLTGGGYRFPFTYAATDYNDVWEYDTATSTWTRAGLLPDSRSGHAMAYDSDRNTIVLYGGRIGGATNELAVLERSAVSSSWAIRNAGGGPGAQSGNTMAYDQNRKRTVILAAAPTGSTVVSVSEWDGAAGMWSSVPASATTPSSRGSAAAVYDPVSQRVILAGGSGSNEAWAYDGSNWTKLANILGGGRTEHAMAYDPLNKRCLLSGGLLGSNSPQRDLLAFTPATNVWASVWSRFSPSPRDFTAAAYDEVGQKTFLFGGHLIPRSTDNQYGSGTFVFDGSDWTSPTLVGNPGVRWQHTLSFDSQRRKFLLFGGRKGQALSAATNETWVLDPVALGWSLLAPAALPPSRYAQSAVFDRVRGRLVVFGGRDVNGSVLGDTWLLDPQTSTWTTLPSADLAPSARSGASMVFDESRGVAVLFGGQVGTGELVNDLWEFDGVQWRSVVIPGFAPVARQWAAMVYHTVRKSVVLFGGVPSGSGAFALDDAWEYDGIRWRSVPQGLVRPIGRFAPAAAFDRARSQVVVFGGDSALNIAYANGQTMLWTLPEPGCGTPVCRSDLNSDQIVDDSDFSVFAFAYDIVVCADPEMPAGCPADINEDGAVDDSDFSEFVYAYDLVVCP
jgi:hypothetical protein